jgi:hypothetical protein
MDDFRVALESPDAAAVLSELCAAYRSPRAAADAGEDRPDIAAFLRARGIDVPAAGTLSVVFTEATSDTEEVLRPLPECPGGYCVPEQCGEGVRQCGWVCYCP